MMECETVNASGVFGDTLTAQRSGDIFRINQYMTSGYQQAFLLMADVHFDSRHCDRQLLSRHLREAKDKGAGIMIFGDVFDCMGGKYDKRTNKEDLRPEYQRANYFDVITDDAAAFFAPYKDNILLISQGNHEQSVLARHEVDLIQNFIQKIGGNTLAAGYDGFVKFLHHEGDKRQANASHVLYFNHGGGGASPITRGVIQTNRRQVAIHADFYVSGHLHAEWEVPLTRVRVTKSDTITIEKVKHWQLGTYAATFGGRWEASKGFAAPTLGGRWVNFRYLNNDVIVESYLAE